MFGGTNWCVRWKWFGFRYEMRMTRMKNPPFHFLLILQDVSKNTKVMFVILDNGLYLALPQRVQQRKEVV